MIQRHLRNTLKLAGAAMLFLQASAARADLLFCMSTVDAVAVLPNGWVSVRYTSLGNLYMCNLDSTQYGVSPATCQSWVASFLTAQTTRKQVELGMDYGSNPMPACSYGVIGNFGHPNPFPYWVNFHAIN